MFYLSEIYYRLVYFLISIIFNIFLLYIYKNDIIFITIIPALLKNNLLDYFIFTEPREILFFYLYSCFSFLLFIILPLIGVNLYDYMKPTVYKKEWNQLIYVKNKLLFIFFFVNFFSFFLGLPLFWDFFSSFQTYSNLFTFFLELSALNYFYYFNSVFIITNLLQLLLTILLFYFYKKGLVLTIFKKLYIYLIFLIFSTVVTPPDLILQVLLFCSLCICLEIFFLCVLIYYSYRNKNN